MRIDPKIKSEGGDQGDIIEAFEHALDYLCEVRELDQAKPASGSQKFKASVNFRIRVFATVTAFRTEDLLLALVSELNARRTASIPFLSRGIMETAAKVHFGCRMIQAHKRRGKFDELGQEFDRLLLGSRVFNGPKGETTRPYSPESLLARMEEDNKEKDLDLRDCYGRISEFVHPNGPALLQLHQRGDEDRVTCHLRRSFGYSAPYFAEFLTPAAMVLVLALPAWKEMFAFNWK